MGKLFLNEKMNYKNIKIQTQTNISFSSFSDTMSRRVLLTPHEQLKLKHLIIEYLWYFCKNAYYMSKDGVGYYLDLIYAYCCELGLNVYNYSAYEFVNLNGFGFETWSSMILEELEKLQINSIEPEEEEYSKPIPSRHLSRTKSKEKTRREMNLQKKKEYNQYDQRSSNSQERRKPKYNSRYHKSSALVEDVSVC